MKKCANCDTVGKLRRGWCITCYSRARRVDFTHVPEPYAVRAPVRSREPQEGGRLCVVCEVPRTGNFTREACNTCYMAMRRAGRVEELPKPTKATGHGRSSLYKRGCRCAPCIKANTVRQAKQIAIAREKILDGTWTGTHGTTYAARSIGCRCELCKPIAQNTQTKYRKPSPDAAFRGIGDWTPREDGMTVVHWPAHDGPCPFCNPQVLSTTQQRKAA